MGQESWHFPCLSLHSKWRSNVLLLLQPIFQVQRLYLLLSSAVVAIFWTSCILLSSVKAIPDVYQCSVWCILPLLDKYPLSERLRLCFEEASLKFQDEFWYFKMSCDISPFTQKTLDIGNDGSYCWCHQMSVLFQNIHCYWHYIWIPERIEEAVPWRDKLVSDYNINAIMSFQCWWWWEYEILMVKDFTTRPQIRFWELKLNKQLMKNWRHFFLPYTIKHFDMLFSPRCLWVERFLMCSQQYLTGVWVSPPTKENTTWWQLLVVFPQDIIEIGNVDLWGLCMVYPAGAFFWY